MLNRPEQRSSLQFAVWSVAGGALAALLLWWTGWLPIEFSEAETGDLASTADAPAVSLDETGSGSEQPVDPIVFEGQSEPPVDGGPQRSPGDVAASGSEPGRIPFAPVTEGSAEGPSGSSDVLKSHTIRRRAAPPPYRGPQESQRAGTAPRRDSQFQLLAAEGDPATRGGITPDETAGSVGERRVTARPPAENADLDRIDRMIEDGDYAAAHRELSKIYWNQPELRAAIRERIETTAKSIFFAPQPHYATPYEIQPGDTLGRIGRRYSVPWQYLVRLNRVDPRRIRPGQKLKVVKGPFHALVDLSDYTLTVHAHGLFVKQYPIGIGKDDTTPLGEFTVRDKVVNPSYTDPEGRVIAADDPQNPIGERWISLGEGYGIHGTIEPESIGKAMSRGCIRMHNADVAEVYDMLGLGSRVVIQR